MLTPPFNSIAAFSSNVTALNFSAHAVEETISPLRVAPGPVVDMLAESVLGDLDEFGTFRLTLEGYRGVSLRIVSSLPPAIVDDPEIP
jgi:hypothetical protein